MSFRVISVLASAFAFESTPGMDGMGGFLNRNTDNKTFFRKQLHLRSGQRTILSGVWLKPVLNGSKCQYSETGGNLLVSTESEMKPKRRKRCQQKLRKARLKWVYFAHMTVTSLHEFPVASVEIPGVHFDAECTSRITSCQSPFVSVRVRSFTFPFPISRSLCLGEVSGQLPMRLSALT